jgi:hypothetical protein
MIPLSVIPISVHTVLPGMVAYFNQSTRLPSLQPSRLPFWDYLTSCGGDWRDFVLAWEDNPTWIWDGLILGTLILSTDGSYRPNKDTLICMAGWTLTCTRTQCILQGSFYEQSTDASSYRGELLGIVAIYALVLAISQYYKLDLIQGKICCDSRSALNKSSQRVRHVCPDTAQADLFCTLHTIRSKLPTTRLIHEWVKSHMDRTVPWDCLTLEQQLNKTCDKLANCAVTRARSRAGAEKPTTLLLPFEGATILVGGIKITSTIAQSVRHILSWEEACKFYTKAREETNGTNKGGLGWSQATFGVVDWSAIAAALPGKPEMFGLWLSKQSIGVCATRKNLGRIQDMLNDQCPNCGSIQEDNNHLNRCPDSGRCQLFRSDVKELQKWLYNNHIDPELAFWIPYYLLLRGQTPMLELGSMSPAMREAAEAQDAIGWTEFRHGKVALKITRFQEIYRILSSHRTRSHNWTKNLVEHLILISHSQWLFRNFSLHHKTKGYLQRKAAEDIQHIVTSLTNSRPDKIPPDCHYLLEIDHRPGQTSSFKYKHYWVQAMKAARKVTERNAALASAQGTGARQQALRHNRARPRSINIIEGVRKSLAREYLVNPPSCRRINRSSLKRGFAKQPRLA